MSYETPAFDLNAALIRQKEQEDTAVNLGTERFTKRLEKAKEQGLEAGTGAARSILANATAGTAAVMQAVVDEGNADKRCQGAAHRWFEMLGVDVIAYLTAKCCLDGLSFQRPLTGLAVDVWKQVQDEVRYRRFEEQAPSLFKYKVKSFKTSNYAYMSQSMDCAMDGLTDKDKNPTPVDCSDLELDKADQVLVGTKFIDCFISGSGLMERKDIQGVNRDGITVVTVLAPTEATLEWMTKRNGALEELFPVNLPMVCPPVDWEPGVRGGYRFRLKNRHSLVRASRTINKGLESEDMGQVYSAINAVQQTPWRINKAVLALIDTLLDAQVNSDKKLAGIPGSKDIDVPKPSDMDTNEKARKLWRKKQGKAKDANFLRKRRQADFIRTLGMARRLKDELAVWFPYTLDFRSRIYPVASYLHPQGDDMAKALLTFSQGEPLGEDGADWLALHGANCLGKTPEGQKTSKMTRSARIAWIREHTARIVAAAEDPMDDLWWAGADDPLQFWAFCSEWAAYQQFAEEGMGAEFTSSLPVAQDGTCNGLQHFSAMALDAIGGVEVNLTPTESPKDIYQKVAELVQLQLELDATGPSEPLHKKKSKAKEVKLNKDGTPRKAYTRKNPSKKAVAKEAGERESTPKDFLARLWLASPLVNRKLTKRPTMTLGYGSKQYGFTDQLVDYVKNLDEYDETLEAYFSVPKPGDTEGRTKSILQDACQYMGALCWAALSETVVKAREVMTWMQTCANLIAATNKRVTWKVPGSGFRVTQGYMQFTSVRIRTVLQGQIFKPRVNKDTADVDARKQATAVAPNIVHSLDAACLMMTVNLAYAQGVTNFGMVHDSYATTAGKAGILARCTREAFVKLYQEHDVLAELYEQFQQQAPEGIELPPPPEKGTLDLSGVLKSTYFFS